MTKDTQIVVVEDSPSDALFTKIALSEVDESLQIEWLKDGEEAINFFFSESGTPKAVTVYERIKVILLDLNLPRYTGIEVLHKLKAHPETASIPVVIFSSSDMRSGIEECLKAGAEEYVVKSIDFDTYTNAIKRVVGGKV